MYCPFCRHPDSRVVDSRTTEDGTAIRRRRSCPECGRRFTTVETAALLVVKRSGVTEPFSRDKVVSGVRKACQGRPVTEDQLAQLAQRVEETMRAQGAAELPSHEVGLAILGPLRELDRRGLPALRLGLPGLRVASRTSRRPSPSCAPRPLKTLRAEARNRTELNKHVATPGAPVGKLTALPDC